MDALFEEILTSARSCAGATTTAERDRHLLVLLASTPRAQGLAELSGRGALARSLARLIEVVGGARDDGLLLAQIADLASHAETLHRISRLDRA